MSEQHDQGRSQYPCQVESGVESTQEPIRVIWISAHECQWVGTRHSKRWESTTIPSAIPQNQSESSIPSGICLFAHIITNHEDTQWLLHVLLLINPFVSPVIGEISDELVHN